MSYEENVFINCPFDSQYRTMMEAIVFVVHDCGFVARSALEYTDSSQVRITKIMDMVGKCRFGIHDISRTELDPVHSLPRFNMPLELGIFLAAKRFGGDVQQTKMCLVLDREPYRYQKFMSDIAGQDISAHGEEPERAIPVVRDWLRNATRGAGTIIPGGSTMRERFSEFMGDVPAMCTDLKLDPDNLIYNDFTTLAVSWLKENPW